MQTIVLYTISCYNLLRCDQTLAAMDYFVVISSMNCGSTIWIILFASIWYFLSLNIKLPHLLVIL